MRIAEGYIEAQRHNTKAQVVKAVSSFLSDAWAKGVDTDIETVLGGELASVWGKATAGMHRIVDTEASNARNMGTLDGIIKVNTVNSIEDPVVYFIVVRDDSLCSECKRLHLLEDGITPRLWRLSQVKHGYHVKGENVPSLGGEHPHCRCTLSTLLPGYGFEGGSITFISLDHDEYKKQNP